MRTWKKYSFLKHKNCTDAFIFIDKIQYIEPNKTIKLKVFWMAQGIYHYWVCSPLYDLIITEEHLDNWLPYKPLGELYE